jgi:hypothetical protein
MLQRSCIGWLRRCRWITLPFVSPVVFLLPVVPKLNWLSFAAVPASEHGIGAQLPDRQVEGSGDGDPEPHDQLLGAEEAVRLRPRGM